MSSKTTKDGITANQKIFCDEYLVDRNATRAYKAAYPHVKDTTAAVEGSKALKKPKIKAYIEKKLEALAKKLDVSFERIVKELASVAFLDIRKLMDQDGNLIDISQLSDEAAAALSGMDVEIEYTGRGDKRHPVGQIRKLKFWNKMDAIKQLATILKLEPPQQIEVTGKDGAPIHPNMDFKGLQRVIDSHRRKDDD